MPPFRILVVDDDETYTGLVKRQFDEPGKVEVVCARTVGEAHERIRAAGDFLVAVVDLNLQEPPGRDGPLNDRGFEVIDELRGDGTHPACGSIILSAVPTQARFRRAFRDAGVHDFMVKSAFDRNALDREVRYVLFATLIKRMHARAERRHVLSLAFRDDRITDIKLRGPGFWQECQPDCGTLDLGRLAERAEHLNRYLEPGQRDNLRDKWLDEARLLGPDLYNALGACGELREVFGAVRSLSKDPRDVAFRFVGTGDSLSVPFELLRDEQEYLALKHLLYRRVLRQNTTWSHKVRAFHTVLERVQSEKGMVRVLLIGSNAGAHLDRIEMEIRDLQSTLTACLTRLGLASQVDLCLPDATCLERATEMLSEKCYHIVHYAGHGTFDPNEPSRSGLVFAQGDGYQVLESNTFKRLLQNSPTQLIFLNCCVGARSAGRKGRDESLGILDAILQADVPAALGYRWVVGNADAAAFASSFYESLFSGLSVEDAVLDARNQMALSKGLEDETWASPILALQTL